MTDMHSSRQLNTRERERERGREMREREESEMDREREDKWVRLGLSSRDVESA